MTVAELITHLQTGDPEAEVIVLGHFGEIAEHLGVGDFDFRNQVSKDRRPIKGPNIEGSYLCIRAVDIGEEPS
jgi:hypothetical protein